MRVDETMNRLLDLAGLPSAALPGSALAYARFSLFDWLVCGRAGASQPLSGIIRDYVLEEGGRPVASVFGAAARAPARAAALVNGTISHALDYDDTHFAHVGHPSVGIMPAALAVAQETGAPAARVAEAFLVGAEASCRIGMVLGRGHYERGFHQTATAGAFGATVAAGRLYGLDRTAMRHALSLVATRASGLKSQFGTMGKPFNAGISASNGVEAAALAGRGFVSADDAVGGLQGFVDTHSEDAADARGWANPPPGHFVFEDIQYKLHACCHGTHAMIEALAAAKREHGLAAGDVAGIELAVNPRWLRVCNIPRPRTGLEVKFSYAWLAGMVLNGVDTSSDAAYVDALCEDARLAAVAGKVRVAGVESVGDTATDAVITLRDNRRVTASHDLAERQPLERIEAGLRAKAAGLLGRGEAEALWSAVARLDSLAADDLGALLGNRA
ncbi:MAG: MmgE/PrpD family protein [Alsobacter sp.]